MLWNQKRCLWLNPFLFTVNGLRKEAQAAANINENIYKLMCFCNDSKCVEQQIIIDIINVNYWKQF